MASVTDERSVMTNESVVREVTKPYIRKEEAGDIVFSGSLGRAVPVERGDVFVLEAHGQPPLTVSFS
jgi:2-keto-4-pentenoate hydratase/2-oxohepta-3-ene-1,7-dioic acid hydratase in catechol pathway